MQAVNSIVKARAEVLVQAAQREERLVAVQIILQYCLNQKGMFKQNVKRRHSRKLVSHECLATNQKVFATVSVKACWVHP